MTFFGMSAGLLVGIISALSTYAVQSITHLDPVFKIFTASTLRSSALTRSPAALAILENDRTGRARILIAQFQGHLFFGNVAALTDSIKQVLSSKKGTDDEPLIVILDFTLVVGMDSSAAHAIAKLKGTMHRRFHVEISIFVTGAHRDGFPCEFALADALRCDDDVAGSAANMCDNDATVDFNDVDSSSAAFKLARARRGSIFVSLGSEAMKATQVLRKLAKDRVCFSLDEALQLAEDVLIARENPLILEKDKSSIEDGLDHEDEELSPEQERTRAIKFMENLAFNSTNDSLDTRRAVAAILVKCKREEYRKDQVIWTAGSPGDSMKLVVAGKLVAYVEGTDIFETVNKGSTIGELGLVQGIHRFSTVECVSTRAVLLSLDRTNWEQLVKENPRASRIIDQIVIRYLSIRVQHVSNRIFETRCLPI